MQINFPKPPQGNKKDTNHNRLSDEERNVITEKIMDKIFERLKDAISGNGLKKSFDDLNIEYKNITKAIIDTSDTLQPDETRKVFFNLSEILSEQNATIELSAMEAFVISTILMQSSAVISLEMTSFASETSRREKIPDDDLIKILELAYLLEAVQKITIAVANAINDATDKLEQGCKNE